MFDFKKITGNWINKTKGMLADTSERANIIDGLFALGHLAQASSKILGTFNDHLSEKVRQQTEKTEGAEGQEAFRALFLDFLMENQHRFDTLANAAPLILEWALAQLFNADEEEGGIDFKDLPLDDFKAWFESLLELAIDRSLGFIENEEVDPVDRLRKFEVFVDMFIQDWLIPQIDKELGI